MNEVTDPVPGLRDALVSAGHRRIAVRARRRAAMVRAGALSTVAVVVVAASLLFSTISSDPASAGVTVTLVDGRWVVAVVDDTVRADRIEAVLEDAGIVATVDAVPVGPSRVGTFLSGDGAVTLVGGDGVSSATVTFDDDVPTVSILFGASAAPGDDYVAFSDAFAPGEPLACELELVGASFADVAETFGARFETVAVLGVDGSPVDAVGPVEGRVVDVTVVAVGEARVVVDDRPAGTATEIVGGRRPGSDCPSR